ncbi:hypothetical protein F503_07485 [Ophiostoma piceae UAMH 11346]|uniref:Methyltransferase type 11 domain-containing protein n=1 Tax=Ophiostoma piceae (strain UAMH 11346) TaxID=1262450 RepID=S3C886_OPHP1|nr:hypothetical protein F503_07485 [Ophiostoma piceae UAMH 11346]
MSSLRPGLEPPSRQVGTTRTRKTEGSYSHGSSTSHLPSRIKAPARELEPPRARPAPVPTSYSSRPFAHPSGRSVSSSKIPQTSFGAIPNPASQRQPSDLSQRSHSRPPLTHQSQSWGTTAGTTSSSRSGVSVGPPPASVPRLPRSMPNSLAQTRGAFTRDLASTQQRIRSRNNSAETSSSSSATPAQTPLEFDRTLTESPAELRVAKQAEVTNAQTVMIYPELDRYRSLELLPSLPDSYGPAHPDMLFRLATENMHAPPNAYFSGSNSQVSAISASPSTRFSESPGPGSYSRDTTPTSMSSQSPGILASGRMPSATRMRQPVRVRAGSFGKDSSTSSQSSVPPTQTLAAIRESLNSSSSSSNGTIRGAEKRDKLKKKRLSPTPPSPPPRKSSQKFKESGNERSSLERPRKSSEEHSRSRPSSSKSNRGKTVSPSRVPAIPTQHQEQVHATGSPRPPQRLIPPSRPSRDGAPDLQSQLDFPLPVIQSNLSHAPSSDHLGISHATPPQSSFTEDSRPQHDHRQLGPSLFPSSTNRHDEPQSSSQKTKNASRPYPTKSVASSSSSHVLLPSKTESGEESRTSKEQGRTTRTPSPNISTFRTRFPLFGRRTKTAPGTVDTVSAGAKDSSSARKGPVAGTGHEGYGRKGSNRRRSSSVSTFLRGTLSSQESLASPQFQDPFLRDRMSPVVIAGGEIIENKNTGYDMARTSSNTSTSASGNVHPGYPRPSTDSRADSLSSREDRTTLWPSALPRGSRRPSDSSDSEAAMRSTLAYRRSVQRLQSPDRALERVPRPIVVRPARPGMPPSINSMDTSIMTDDSAPSTRPELLRGRKGSNATEAAPAATKKLTKRQRSPRKWNLFGRSQSQPATSKKALQSTSTVAVTVETFPTENTKPVAFYAMIDSSEPEDGDMDVEDILREASMPDSPASLGRPRRDRRPSIEQVSIGNNVTARPTRDISTVYQQPQQSYPQPLAAAQHPPHPQQPDMTRHHQHQQRYAPPPTSRPQQPQYGQQVQEAVNSPQLRAPDIALPTVPMMRSGRPSRLPQVGRIPKVVSARPEQTSPKSFSRPFNRISVQIPSTASTPLMSMDTESIAKGPTPPNSDTPDLMHDGSTVTHNATPEIGFVGSGAEFFTMATRKDSQTTSGTSSSGVYSFADATAIVPSPSAPLAEDEIWDEYNDLLEDRPTKVRASATSSHGLPFHLEADAKSIPVPIPYQTKVGHAPNDTKAAPLKPSAIVIAPRQNQSIDETILHGRPPIASSIYSTDFVIESADVNTDQRVSSVSQPPATPFSVSEFISGYEEDRNNSVSKAKKAASPQRNSGSSGRSVARKTRASDGSVYSQVSEDNSPISQVNLRVGSMTVSKWLTFGHVLFSPARDDMVLKVSPPNGHSVLVIDGLGNDDWSFYAAETYPAATFFNLSPRAPLPVDQNGNAPAFPITPPNHHQIQYKSNGDKFPFQAEIFTTVVYRFPTAAPESHYRNVINEARRVLKPGGYLELSILDLDLNNMGPRTRRAIRRLKEQTHTHTPKMHLGSTADAILRLLSTRSFTDVKSCRVGIPVASPIPRSGSEISNNDPKRPPLDKTSSADSTVKTAKKPKDQRSLAEMINDESPVADESITNMVARVGRWWHSRCYGDSAMDPSARKTHNDSISASGMWTDRALLAECDEWRTNLKLTVCYARAPDTKRVASI